LTLNYGKLMWESLPHAFMLTILGGSGV